MNENFNAIVAEDFDGKTIASLKSITLDDLPDDCLLYTSPSPRDRG